MLQDDSSRCMLQLPPGLLAKIRAVSQEFSSDRIEPNQLAQFVYSTYHSYAFSALKLFQIERRLGTGDEVLDRLLGGGFLTGSLTEVFGSSATGKTQLALQLCLFVQLPISQKGLDGHALFIASGKKFPFHRLYTIADELGKVNPFFQDSNFGDRVHAIHVNDLEAESHIIRYFVPQLLNTKPIRLIILDSPSFNLRLDEIDTTEEDFETRPVSLSSQKGMRNRMAAYWSNLKILQSLAKRYQLVVIVLSQVSSATPTLNSYVSNLSSSAKSQTVHTKELYCYNPHDNGFITPVMSSVSSQIVNTRMFLEMGQNRSRKMHIIQSSCHGLISSPYDIVARGISLTES